MFCLRKSSRMGKRFCWFTVEEASKKMASMTRSPVSWKRQAFNYLSCRVLNRTRASQLYAKELKYVSGKELSFCLQSGKEVPLTAQKQLLLGQRQMQICGM